MIEDKETSDLDNKHRLGYYDIQDQSQYQSSRYSEVWMYSSIPNKPVHIYSRRESK